jgi:sugar O-acyltransferase (sialic acid O-acetyltransferase NeuD family)
VDGDSQVGDPAGRQVVVFGDGQVAELAHYYLVNDSPHDVVAFTVDRERITSPSFRGLPVVAFEDASTEYPPDRFSMFIAIGYPRINKIRQEKYLRAKEMGFELITYVSSKAMVWPSTAIGDNCLIMEGNIIQPYARIGNDVVMWAGCHIGHHAIIKDHCFVSSHTVISGNVIVEENCFFGVNATIRNGVTIGREGVIGAGVVIMKDTKERGVYVAPGPQLLALTSDRLPNL